MSFKRKALPAMAVAGLLVFMGVSTASATVLCRNAENTKCKAPVPAETVIEATSTAPMVIHTVYKQIECKKSTLDFKTQNESGEFIVGSIQELTFAECNCTVVVLDNGVFAIGNNAGTTNGRFITTETEITTTCNTILGAIHCTYTTNSTELGTVLGGNPAKLSNEATLVNLPTHVLCGEERTLTSAYEITNPKPLYVAAS
jgi:hypothetical protein